MNPPFEPGQKVLCINDQVSSGFWEWGDRCPCAGEVYTVREVRFGSHPQSGESGPGLLLEEIRNTAEFHREVLFNAKRFVPLPDEEELSALGESEEISLQAP